jgi:hypothetical protein
MNMKVIGLSRWNVNITMTVLGIIHRTVIYLEQKMDYVRTSLETHYVSATNRTG